MPEKNMGTSIFLFHYKLCLQTLFKTCASIEAIASQHILLVVDPLGMHSLGMFSLPVLIVNDKIE